MHRGRSVADIQNAFVDSSRLHLTVTSKQGGDAVRVPGSSLEALGYMDGHSSAVISSNQHRHGFQMGVPACQGPM